MRKPQLLAILVFIAPLTLAACGQKGALYLSADEPAPAVDATANDADTKKEDAQAPGSSY
jgi:predicted small lipoprotein YifL